MAKEISGNPTKVTAKDVVKTKKTGVIYKQELARKIIMGKTKEQFHHEIVRGVTKDVLFGSLVTFGAGSLSSADKITIRAEMAKAGIPLDLTCSDELLDEIAGMITDRSVQLK